MSKVEGKAFEPTFIQGGSHLRVLEGHKQIISHLRFSPDGKQLLSGSQDDTARLWDVESGRELACFTGHTNWIKSIAFSDNGDRAITGSLDATCRVWDCKTGNQVAIFTDPNKSSPVAGISPDGRHAVAGAEDGCFRLWDVQTGQEIQLLGEHMTGMIWAGFSPNAEFAVMGSGKAICFYRAKGGQEAHRLDCGKSRLKAVVFSKDGRLLLSGSEDGVVRLMDIEEGKEVRNFNGYNNWLHTVAFSPDHESVMAAYDSWQNEKPQLTVRTWNINNERESRDVNFQGHRMSISAVAISPDCRTIATGSNDKTICIWQMPDK